MIAGLMARKSKPSPARMNFAQRLRKARQKVGLSQEALAAKAGLHRNYVGSVERGERNIAIDNMGKLAKALDVSLAHLVKEDR